MTNESNLQPVIISGGAGRRLWPVSRSMYPKQFQRFDTSNTLFQETLLRVRVEGISDPLIVCNQEHRFIAAEQMHELGIEAADILLEPEGRNTAPAIAVAAAWAEKNNPDGVLVILPSDHMIHGETGAFVTHLRSAAMAAMDDQIVLFGVDAESDNPEYGYINAGDATSEAARKVLSFREKPDKGALIKILGEKNWLWNTGIVVARPASLLREIELYGDDIVSRASASLENAAYDLDYVRLDPESFTTCPAVSFDHAVLEKSSSCVVLDFDLPWADASSWELLWKAGDRDADGNLSRGDIILKDTRDSVVISEDSLVATIGLDHVAVIVTDDSVLVADLDHANDVENLLPDVAEHGQEQHMFHSTVYRPWGSYRSLATGPRFQVKEIIVKPGASISLQKHFHRAEHWIVVEGTAKIRCNDDEFVLKENESTYIPLGAIHRLENPGIIEVRLIEVQSGSYLGEDDIVRFEDTYGRS